MSSSKGIAPLTLTLARSFSLLIFLGVLCACWILSGYVFTAALLGLITFTLVQRVLLRLIVIILPREVNSVESNLAWWDGRWLKVKGWRSLYAPFREFLCKAEEMCCFAYDFFQANIILIILFPATLIKFVDVIHSLNCMYFFEYYLLCSISNALFLKTKTITSNVGCY